MPKMKTKKAIAKRFKVSASGKVLAKQVGITHLAPINSGARARSKRKLIVVDDTLLRRWKNKSIILTKVKRKP